jgi:hypothetical protein
MSKSVSLNDVNNSQNGEAAHPSADIPTYESTLPLPPSTPKAEETVFKVFRLVKGNRKGRVYIDGQDDVINPKTGKLERMRLLRGVSDIWLSEQKDLPKEFVERNKRSLIFDGPVKKKVLRIPDWDKAAIEFIENCRHYIDNPNRRSGSKHEFYEWNPKRQEEMRLQKQLKVVEAIKVATAMPDEKMKKHALYLGVSFADELGMAKSIDGIRNDYIMKAMELGEKFLESAENPEVNISYMVKRAISDSKIDLGKEPNSAFWSSGGGFIAKIPQNRKAVDYLIELAMTNSEDGKSFVKTLETVVK